MGNSRSLCILAFYLISLFLATAVWSLVNPSFLLGAEKAILEDADAMGYPKMTFADDTGLQYGHSVRSIARTCKVLLGDSNWPNVSAWSTLNSSVGGNLVMPDPIAKVCYAGSSYNAGDCTVVANSWSDSDLHINHPSSIMATVYEGLSCLPTDNSTASNCTIGGYPVYVVNAQTAKDVQAAVNFARNANIRLVIKNTGHDFSGKSAGKGSLSIRTHGLSGVSFFQTWVQGGYSGPAFRVGAGVQAKDLYAAAHAQNVVVVGGEGMTVGWGGGYIQGGGHSPLGSILGMAADHVLSFEVVTADGSLVTAEESQNTDLFWALRGGGGSTFGVVISITVKAYPDLPVTTSTFSFTPSKKDISQYPGSLANDDFWAVVRSYFELLVPHVNQGTYAYHTINPTDVPGEQVFKMAPFFAPNKTINEVNVLLQPIVDKAKSVNITLELNTTSFSGFYPAWQAGFPKETIGYWDAQIGSRLFPRSSWLDDKAFNDTFGAIRTQVSNSSLVAFTVAPTLAAGGNPDNAVNPAWRNTVIHCITNVFWDINLRDLATIRSIQHNFTNINMKSWQDVSPGAGAYLNEADFYEPNFQQSFWGSKYPRLYQIKQEVDPSGVFFAELAVGSEDWTTGVSLSDRLCPL